MKPLNRFLGCTFFIIVFITGCSVLQTPISLPLISEHNCIDLDKITSLRAKWVKDDQLGISKLMLMYIPFDQFKTPNTIEVYIPVDGEIQSIIPADNKNPLDNVILTIHAKDDPAITIELHNIDLNSKDWGVGATVKAGMHIAYADEELPASICVLQNRDNEITSHLFLHITADYVFELYQDRGIETRDVFELINNTFFTSSLSSESITLNLKKL
jgi:hypothetical protein